MGRNCSDGYKLVDHIRDFRQGGGTPLLFRDSLTVKKVGGGAKMSFEFSELTVQLASSYGLRLVVVFRPQSDSDDHRIPMTTFPNLHAPTFASEVGKYFVSKIDTIQRQIGADIIDLPASAFTTADGFHRSTPSLSAFKILSANSVKSLIHNSTLKSCPLDPMPSRLVSRCDALLPVITTIIDKSLEAGHFPKSWKEALVCPLHKKPGLHIILKNFRPVSNSAFLSKFTEKALFHQMHEYMVDTNLYPNVQSAYRVHHSTETALLKSYIMLNINKQHVTLLVLLDLSAAFDTVEHKILLEALNTLGLGGRVSKWF